MGQPDPAAGGISIPVFANGGEGVLEDGRARATSRADEDRIADAIGVVEFAMHQARAEGEWGPLFAASTLGAFEVLRELAEASFSVYLSELPFDRKREVLRRLNGSRAAIGRAEERLQVLSGGVFIEQFRPAEMLIDPILARGHVVAMTAHPNGGKSSIAVQLALAAAGLAHLPDLDVDPAAGRVLYLAGDSDANFALQLIAALEQHARNAVDLDGRLWVIPRRFALTSHVDEIRSLAQQCGGFDLVVVDTRAAYSDADDENDAMQALADAVAARELTRLEGAPSVLVLCHPTKSAARDQMTPRGGGSFLGEVDENLVLWNADGVIELTASKRRIPDFDPIRWRFEVVEVDRVDSRGRPVRSVRACRVTDGQAAQAVAARRQDENRLLHAMLHHPQESRGGWARLCGWLIEGGKQAGHPHKTKVARVLARLQADRLVECHRGLWRLTEAGKREARTIE